MRTESSPVVLKRTFIEEARRVQVIDGAIDVLAEFGYTQTSFARIAEHVGISKSVISYHFASKDELLEQVIKSVYLKGASYMTTRVQAESSAPAMLAAYLRSNLEFIRDHGKEIAAVAEIVINVRTKDGVRRFAGGFAGMDAALKPLQTMFRRGQAEGDFADFDTRTMAWAIRNLIDGVNRRRTLDSEFDFDSCIEELIALFDRATRKAGA